MTTTKGINMDLSLYGIETELINLFNEISENEGELTEEMQNKLRSFNMALIEKVDACYGYRKSLEDFENLIDSKISELKQRKEQLIKKQEKFDEYVDACLKLTGKKELVGELYKITKRKPSMVVEITDENKLPIEFIKIPEPKPVIMKKEIGDVIKSGQQVEGAKLVESNTISIQYKIK